ncbi:Trafficking protein particle complex 8 [Clydaea vesicula]|uniref:Trafficking protein particle complex 8 n=1 Tax=Clydaea vesicula TaxID=447962 RepID=A0AAD5Y0S1_9FUNG|nr:Trafficking protein particle complex 8 [Clydaea vesicula]
MAYIQKCLSPLAAIIGSEDTRSLTSKNNLPDLAALFSPFGDPITSNVTLRDSKGQASVVDNFTLRFKGLNELDIFDYQQLNSVLTEPLPPLLHGNLKVDLNLLKQSGVGIEYEDFERYTPWYTQYRDYFSLFDGPSEHETFNHPIACIFVVTTENPDPVSTFSLLSSQASLPKIFEKGFMDKNFLKHFLLIHEEKSQSQQNPEQTLIALKKAFGLNCSLLKLSGKENLTELRDKHYYDYWENHIKLQEGFSKAVVKSADENLISVSEKDEQILHGLHFSKVDINNIETFVIASRKGMAGRLFSAFSRSSKSSVQPKNSLIDASGKFMYLSDSSEVLQRKLADYSFMLRDYVFAYSIYDSARKLYQNNEQASRYFAGSQEMLGFCVLMTEGVSKVTIESNFDLAVDTYKFSKDFLYETRCTALFFEMLKHKKFHRDAPTLLNKMTGESAFCFLTESPIMARKYAFFLVLAANRYTKCLQRAHAFRCYSDALNVYETQGWTLVEDHINFSLSRQSIHMGDLVSGVNFLSKLMRSSRQSPKIQAEYLKDFYFIYGQLKSIGKKEDMEKLKPLNIPIFIDKSTIISLSRNALNSQSQNDERTKVNDEHWELLESDLVEYGYNKNQAIKKNSSNFSKIVSVKQAVNILTCAVGESVFVHLEIENPLQVSITLSNISVRCNFGSIPREDEDYNDGDRSNLILVERSGFTVENIPDFILGPNERAKLQVAIIPKQEGTIYILGVVYLVGGLIPCFKSLKSAKKNLNKEEEFVTPKLNVTLPMPVLDIEILNFPEKIFSGEIIKLFLNIKNNGNRGLVNLKLKLSHPSFFYFGSLLDVDQEEYVYLENGKNSEKFLLNNNLNDFSLLSIKLPTKDLKSASEFEDGVLMPEQSCLVPIFLRGDRMGKHTFRFLFGYQAEENETPANFRTFKFTQNLNVQPSLRINAFTRPSQRNLDEFTLGIEIENLQNFVVLIKQLSAVSSKWQIKTVNGLFSRIDNFKFEKETSPEHLVSKVIESIMYTEENITIYPPPLNFHISSLSMDKVFTCSENPFKEFSCRSRTQWRMTSLSQNYNGLSPEKLRKLFTLYYSDDVDLTLFWEMPATSSKEKKRLGHQYIMGINLSLQSPLTEIQSKFLGGKNMEGIPESRALFEQTVREKKTLINTLLKSKSKEVSPLRIVFNVNENYFHDFIKNGDCVLSFPVVLNNSSSVRSVKFTLELLSAENGSNLKVMIWSGKNFINGILKPEEEGKYNVFATFASPGIYELNRWKLSVHMLDDNGNEDKGNSGFIQTPNLNQSITVHNRIDLI